MESLTLKVYKGMETKNKHTCSGKSELKGLASYNPLLLLSSQTLIQHENLIKIQIEESKLPLEINTKHSFVKLRFLDL